MENLTENMLKRDDLFPPWLRRVAIGIIVLLLWWILLLPMDNGF